MKSFALIVFCLAITGCSVDAGMDDLISKFETPGEDHLKLNVPASTSQNDARFVYCNNGKIEVGIDFRDKYLGASDALQVARVGHRNSAGSFNVMTVGSISEATSSGTHYYAIVATDSNGTNHVYGIETSNHTSGGLEYSIFGEDPSATTLCRMYTQNPFYDTPAWPAQ